MLQHLCPTSLTPPHAVVRPEQVDELAADMRAHGWRGAALVGYPHQDGVQLLTGTHRQAASIRANMATIPVQVYPYALVARCWGRLNRWMLLLQGRL
jgi:ParB-like chromosome segregation protein Spo0J